MRYAYSGTCTGDASTYYYTRIVVRTVYVKIPAHWEKADIADFVELVNTKINSGWQIKAVIHGDILITDPDAEIMKMRDFRVTLEGHCTKADRDKIAEFFDAHPIKKDAV